MYENSLHKSEQTINFSFTFFHLGFFTFFLKKCCKMKRSLHHDYTELAAAVATPPLAFTLAIDKLTEWNSV